MGIYGHVHIYVQVGWITVLDSVPDIDMLDYLPDFLDGLFNMLSDGNREIRQAADSALTEFLREIKQTEDVDFGRMVEILVGQCNSKERFNRLTAVTWVHEFVTLGGEKLVEFYAELLAAIMHCISDSEHEIRQKAETSNADLLQLVKSTAQAVELVPIMDKLNRELSSDHAPTRKAALRWISMLLDKYPNQLLAHIGALLPTLLKTLSDASDKVVLLDLEVLARISLNAVEFEKVLNAILQLFAHDRRLLETRGSMIVRKLCELLDAKNIYMIFAKVLGAGASSLETQMDGEFASVMVQTLNLILLTANELEKLRVILRRSFQKHASDEDVRVFTVRRDYLWFSRDHQRLTDTVDDAHRRCSSRGATTRSLRSASASSRSRTRSRPRSSASYILLHVLFACILCICMRFLATGASLHHRWRVCTADIDASVGFLMQIDKLVQLLESPIFIHMRLQLLEIHEDYHANLVKSLYGLLMLLPQSAAFRMLRDRLVSVTNMATAIGRIELSGSGGASASVRTQRTSNGSESTNGATAPLRVDTVALLAHFDAVQSKHMEIRKKGAAPLVLLTSGSCTVVSNISYPDLASDGREVVAERPRRRVDAHAISYDKSVHQSISELVSSSSRHDPSDHVERNVRAKPSLFCRSLVTKRTHCVCICRTRHLTPRP